MVPDQGSSAWMFWDDEFPWFGFFLDVKEIPPLNWINWMRSLMIRQKMLDLQPYLLGVSAILKVSKLLGDQDIGYLGIN